MMASSTWAVQMFDVAFSRRMCCSRVCRARRSAGRPVGVDGHADEPAGQGPGERRRGWPGSRRGARRSPSARRSAGPSRRRCRRPRSPGGRAAAAPAGRRRPRRGRRRRAPRRSRRERRRAQPARRARATGPARRTRPSGSRRVRGRRPRARCRAARPGCAPRRWSGDGSRRRRRTSSPGWLRQPAGTCVMASAAAVASSSIEALARSRPVRSATIVWKLRSASSRPWLISGWYGRVGRVPRRVLEHVAQDHRRRDRAVVAQADQRGEHLVAAGQLAQAGQHLGLGAAAGSGRSSIGGWWRARPAASRASTEAAPTTPSMTSRSASVEADVAAARTRRGAPGVDRRGGRSASGPPWRRLSASPAVGCASSVASP